MREFSYINPDDYPNLEENDELALFELFLMDENWESFYDLMKVFSICFSVKVWSEMIWLGDN